MAEAVLKSTLVIVVKNHHYRVLKLRPSLWPKWCFVALSAQEKLDWFRSDFSGGEAFPNIHIGGYLGIIVVNGPHLTSTPQCNFRIADINELGNISASRNG